MIAPRHACIYVHEDAITGEMATLGFYSLNEADEYFRKQLESNGRYRAEFGEWLDERGWEKP